LKSSTRYRRYRVGGDQKKTRHPAYFYQIHSSSMVCTANSQPFGSLHACACDEPWDFPTILKQIAMITKEVAYGFSATTFPFFQM